MSATRRSTWVMLWQERRTAWRYRRLLVGRLAELRRLVDGPPFTDLGKEVGDWLDDPSADTIPIATHAEQWAILIERMQPATEEQRTAALWTRHGAALTALSAAARRTESAAHRVAVTRRANGEASSDDLAELTVAIQRMLPQAIEISRLVLAARPTEEPES